MPNPHLDYGVPWTISTPTTPPVSTGTPNFGPPGTGGNNQPPPPQVTTPVSTGTPNFGPPGTGGNNQPPPTPIIDVAAEQDAEDDALAIAAAENAPSTFISPNEIYPWLEDGTPSENLVNVSQVGGGPNSPGSLLYGINLEDYGFDPKAEFLPQDFLDSLFEGSIVSGNEAVLSDEPNIGTWSDVEEGTHPLFPGGLEDYYDPYGNLGDAWHEPSGGPSWEGYGGDYYDPRQETFDKLRFLQAGLPQRGMEQSGFFGEMTDPYSADVSEALNKGIFSGAMRQGVFDPKGLRRLITSFGSGVTKPRYANIARGGIVSLVGE